MVDIRRHKESVEAVDKTIPRTGQALSPRITAIDYTKTPHVINTISFEEYLKIRLLNGNENIPIPILEATPFKLHQAGTTSVRFLDSKDGVPKHRILFLEPIEPEFKRTSPETTAQYGSASLYGSMRRKVYDEKGNILQAERDDVDEVLEDVHEKILNSPERKLGIWDALDLVLPLKEN